MPRCQFTLRWASDRYGAAVLLAEIVTAYLVVGMGLFMTVLGGLTATNYRRFADRQLMNAEASVRWLRRIPPWSLFPVRPGKVQRSFQRVIAGIFATLGPLVVFVGVHAALSGDLATSAGRPPQPLYQWHPMSLLFGIGCLLIWSLWLARLPSVRTMCHSERRSARVLVISGFAAMVLCAAGIALVAPLLFLIGIGALMPVSIAFSVSDLRHPGDSTAPEVVRTDPLYSADVAWPERRADIVEAVATLATEPPETGAGESDPTAQTCDVAVRHLVDDTGWHYRHRVAEIGTILRDEKEAEALGVLVAAIVSIRVPAGTSRSGGIGWPQVQRTAGEALEAMRY